MMAGISSDMKKYIVSENVTVKEAIGKMEKELIKAVVVTSEDLKVKGLFSNGDMRNFFLRGGLLSAPITDAMNKNPAVYRSTEDIIEERKTRIRVIYPMVDKENRLSDIIDFENRSEGTDKISDELRDIPLVIMAGGKGTRLYPYTKILPKPLIPIGDTTITERIIESFKRYGCKRVIMILNHKANMIKAYMNDLEKDYDLEFVEEKEFLGTAGGIRLLRDKIDSTFFLSNCDILLNADLECVYRTHKMKGNMITFVCSMKDVVIPYGVVETDENGGITAIQEKPDFSFLVNTGLYMLEPEVMDDIGEGEYIHLPDLAKRYMMKGKKVGVFPVSDRSWMDMGQFSEMENMLKELRI